MKIFKKIIIVLSLLYTSSVCGFADTMKDLEIAQEIMEISSCGNSCTADELENMENLVSNLTDKNLALVWTANIVQFSLSTQPMQCDIAKRNIPRLDQTLKPMWETNYNLFGC
tara:strand:+ start:181 stop:519 length:339 start_codon:yes stop_codon:yes gene_type:complete